eukprot:5283675-Pyramimonas_sp.AAC.1
MAMEKGGEISLPRVRKRAPSTLRTLGPSSLQTFHAEIAQFTAPKSAPEETPPEAGSPPASATILLPGAWAMRRNALRADEGAARSLSSTRSLAFCSHALA